jgi:uncharacterized phage protein (TIGR01671 family)
MDDMNRIIKFRVWDYSDKKFTSVLQLPNPDVVGVVTWMNYPAKYIYQQYTGLLDKNGKEIYEDDIIRWKDDIGFSTKPILIDKYGSVYWEDRNLSFCVDEKNYKYKIALFTIKECEIIGNIFENPELLK